MVLTGLNESPKIIQSVFLSTPDEIRCLLYQNTNVQETDGERRTALHAAAYLGNDEIAQILLDYGAKVNAKDAKWACPIHNACYTNSHQVVCVLQRNNANMIPRDCNWQTPLHVAAAQNALECARVVIGAQPGSVNIVDKHGSTALHIAAYTGNAVMVELLLASRAAVNQMDTSRKRPIHWAASRGYLNILNLLVRFGSDISCADSDGWTVLHFACSMSHLSIVKRVLQLIEEGVRATCQAERDAISASGEGGGGVVEEDEQQRVVDALKRVVTARTLRHGNSPLHLACLNSYDQIATTLLNSLANKLSGRSLADWQRQLILAENSQSLNCVHLAAGGELDGDNRTLKLLLDNLQIGVEPPLAQRGEVGGEEAGRAAALKWSQLVSSESARSPLHLAAIKGRVSAARVLLERGAALLTHSPHHELNDNENDNLSQSNRMTQQHDATPLWLACRFGHDQFVSLVLNQMARDRLCRLRNSSSSLSSSTLQSSLFASDANNTSVGEAEAVLSVAQSLLLRAGPRGLLPIQIALRSGHDKVVSRIMMFIRALPTHTTAAAELRNPGGDGDEDDVKKNSSILARIARHVDDYGQNVFLSAVAGGSLACVEQVVSGFHAFLRHPLHYHHHKQSDDVTAGVGLLDRADHLHQNALHLCAQRGLLEMAAHLMALRIQTGGERQAGDAAGGGSGEMRQEWVGESLNALDVWGCTPLHYAAAFDRTESAQLVSLLIRNGANPNALTKLIDPHLFLSGRRLLTRCLASNRMTMTQQQQEGEEDLICCAEEERIRLLPAHFAVVANNAFTLPVLLLHLSEWWHCHLLLNDATLLSVVSANNNAMTATTNEEEDGASNTTPPLIHLAAHRGFVNLLHILLSYSQHHPHARTSFSSISQHDAARARSQSATQLIECVDAQGRTALHLAAHQGFSSAVSVLLEHGADPFVCDAEFRWNAVHYAAAEGQLDVLQEIFGARQHYHQHELHLSSDDKEKQIQTLIHSQDDHNRTPLMLSVQNGHNETATYLLELSPVAVFAADSYGRTSMHRAVAAGHLQCMSTLLAAATATGLTSGSIASANEIESARLANQGESEHVGEREAECVDGAAVSSNANSLLLLLAEDFRGRSVLHMAAAAGNVALLWQIFVELSLPDAEIEAANVAKSVASSSKRLLIRREHGTRVFLWPAHLLRRVWLDTTGLSPLHFAANCGRTNCLKLLIELDIEDELIHVTSSHFAGVGDNDVIINGNIEAAANDAAQEEEEWSSTMRAPHTGWTPLHCAVQSGVVDCVQLILNHQQMRLHLTNPAADDVDDGDNGDDVIKDKQNDSAEFEAEATTSSSRRSSKSMDFSWVVNVMDQNSRTPLHTAAFAGQTITLHLLISIGANVNLGDVNGTTPLMMAINQNRLESVEILLKNLPPELQKKLEQDKKLERDQTFSLGGKGAANFHHLNVEQTDNSSSTILHLASRLSDDGCGLVILDKLDESCAKRLLNMSDGVGQTPLHLAAANGLPVLLQAFLQLSDAEQLLAQDSQGNFPVLCCAPNPRVAQCLMLCLASMFPGFSFPDTQKPELPAPPPTHPGEQGELEDANGATQKTFEPEFF